MKSKQKQTKINQLYNAYLDNPFLSISQASDMLAASASTVRIMRSRLIDKGFIEEGEDGEVVICRPFEGRFCEISPLSWKAEILRELIELAMDDVRHIADPKDKLPYIQEIRAMLKMSV